MVLHCSRLVALLALELATVPPLKNPTANTTKCDAAPFSGHAVADVAMGAVVWLVALGAGVAGGVVHAGPFVRT